MMEESKTRSSRRWRKGATTGGESGLLPRDMMFAIRPRHRDIHFRVERMSRLLRATQVSVVAGALAALTLVANPASAAPDVSPPVVSDFDFAPKKIDLSTGSKVVTLTVHITDETGVAGNVLGDLISRTTTQTRGFVWMDRISGTGTDGVYQGSIEVPDNVAPGAWDVTLFPVDDTLGNSGGFTTHPVPLMVRYGDAAPNAPTGVKATAGNGMADVSWTAPTSDQPVTSYTVTSAPGGITKTVSGSTTATTIDGLSNGRSYTFTVIATSAVGDSASSVPSNAVVPATVPAAPTGVAATGGDESAQVRWTPPSDNGGSPITGYNVTVSPGGMVVPMVKSSTSGQLRGLTNGVDYTFTVTATNAAGESAPSASSSPVTPAGAPSRVAKPTAKVKGTKVTLRWLEPSAHGTPITGYLVKWTRGSKQVDAPLTTLALQLKPGSYKFTVRALSAVGSSPASPAVKVKVKKR